MRSLDTIKTGLVLLALAFTASAQAGLFGGNDPIKDEGLAKLGSNNVKRVVVPYFKVIVHTKLNKTAHARSGLFGTGKAEAKSAMFTQWKEPDVHLLQQVADDAWKAFETQLAAAGFEVVPLSRVIASEAFKKINAGVEPIKTEKYVAVAPRGLKVYDPDGKIDPDGSFFLGLANMNRKLEGEIARELLGTLEGVAVARITLNLAYGAFETDVDSYTAMGSFDRDSASAKVAFLPVLSLRPLSPTVTPEMTGIELQSRFDSARLPNGAEFIAPKDYTRVHLNATLLGGKPVSRIEDVTSAGAKAAAASVRLLGVLAGRGASLEVGEFVAHVDGPAFRDEARAEINKLAGLIGQRLAGRSSAAGARAVNQTFDPPGEY